MTLLQSIQAFIEQLDNKKFSYYAAAFVAILVIIVVIINYHYYAATNALLKNIATINKKRGEIKELLERYEIVKKQQAEVNTLLEKDNDFKIAGYFESVIKKLNLNQQQTREPETSSQELDNGYTEIKLYASFNNINMQKLTELLDTLEQNERIYTKEVEIYKPNHDRSININLLIATLAPTIQTEQTE